VKLRLGVVSDDLMHRFGFRRNAPLSRDARQKPFPVVVLKPEFTVNQHDIGQFLVGILVRIGAEIPGATVLFVQGVVFRCARRSAQ